MRFKIFASTVYELTEGFTAAFSRPNVVDECGRRCSPVLGQSSGGHVCYPVEQLIASFCVLGAQPTDIGNRRLEHGLDVYAFPPPVLGRILTLQSKFDFSGLGSTTLISETSIIPILVEEPVRLSARSWTETDAMASEAGSVPPSHVETVTKSLQSRGFSRRIAGLISTAKRHSTESVYPCHWRAWVRWATERDFDPLSPSSCQ